MKDLQWFIDRVGYTILRNGIDIEIESDAMAQELFDSQSDDCNFSEKLRVYRAPLPPCESCSA